MSSEEDRYRRAQRLKRKYDDDNDYKGPFAPKVKHKENTRKRLNPREVNMYYDDDTA